MSLDLYFEVDTPDPPPKVKVWQKNITHNLIEMAEAANLYKVLWRPEEIGIERAGQMVEPLERGLADLLARPEHFRSFDPPNGWGSYEGLVKFVAATLEAAREHPEATVRACR